MTIRIFIIVVALLVYFVLAEHYYVVVPVVFFAISYNLILIILDFVNENKKEKKKNLELNSRIIPFAFLLSCTAFLFSDAENIIGFYRLTNILLLFSFVVFTMLILRLNKIFNLNHNKFENILTIIIGITGVVVSLGWSINNFIPIEDPRIQKMEVWDMETEKNKKRRGIGSYIDYYIYVKTPYRKERFRVSDEFYFEVYPNDTLNFTIRKGLLGFDKIEKIGKN